MDNMTCKPLKERLNRLILASMKKWNKDSNMNIGRKCPFCEDVETNNMHDCDLCICPPEICRYYGCFGTVGRLIKLYGSDWKIRDLSPIELRFIRKQFRKYLDLTPEEDKKFIMDLLDRTGPTRYAMEFLNNLYGITPEIMKDINAATETGYWNQYFSRWIERL